MPTALTAKNVFPPVFLLSVNVLPLLPCRTNKRPSRLSAWEMSANTSRASLMRTYKDLFNSERIHVTKAYTERVIYCQIDSGRFVRSLVAMDVSRPTDTRLTAGALSLLLCSKISGPIKRCGAIHHVTGATHETPPLIVPAAQKVGSRSGGRRVRHVCANSALSSHFYRRSTLCGLLLRSAAECLDSQSDVYIHVRHACSSAALPVFHAGAEAIRNAPQVVKISASMKTRRTSRPRSNKEQKR